MKLKLNLLVVLAAMLGMFACNNAKKEVKPGMILSGIITGVVDGTKLELSHYTAGGMQKDTATIKEGRFEIKGDYPIPSLCYLKIAGTNTSAPIYVENAPITITADVKDFTNMKITGSKEHDTYAIYLKERNIILAKYKDVRAELYKPGGNSMEKAEELRKKLEPMYKEIEALKEKFIREYPSSAYAARLVSREFSGKNYKGAQKIVAAMDPQLQNNPVIVSILADLAKKGEKDVSIDELMTNVKNVSYQVDKNFKGETLTDIIYLGAFKNNNICALKKDGSIQVIDSNGKVLKNLKPEHNGRASSLAIDADDNIYLLCAIQEEVEKKIRGRKMKRMMPKGVECVVLDENGKKKAKYALKDVITASGARVIDNNLVIADCKGSRLAMFNKTTGEAGPVMKDMRPCCGILDFSVNAKKEILVANLGAFRVQGFNFSGESILTFGQRGKTLNDFHGCCNPVSVASLNSGAIVTVEKSPTRIKVYSSAGAQQIAGIEELVKGCSYIPMISDGSDNLYLASAKKGIVKCVSVN